MNCKIFWLFNIFVFTVRHTPKNVAFKAVSSVCSNKRSFGSGTSRYQASLYIFHSFFWISNYFQIKFERDKVQWVVLATLQFKSWSGSCNEIWILCPFSKAAEKTRPCFALEYWAMILDFVSAVSVQCKENFNFYVLIYTLPLARPAQVKIQMLTTSTRIVTILLKSLLKSSDFTVAVSNCFILKVSKYQKEIVVSSILQKNEQNFILLE